MKPRLPSLIFTVFAMAVLILDSRHTVQFAAEGIDLCIRTVIPSLFPFFILSIYLTGILTGGSGLMPVLISGFLGGYPAGAQAAASLWRAGRVSKEYASMLLLFCSQAGPSFLFGMVAVQFPQTCYVWKLWAIQILSAFSVYTLVPLKQDLPISRDSNPPISPTAAMQKAMKAIASVCGWVVIFRVILGYLSALPLAGAWKPLLSGLLELANGCLGLETVENISQRFFLAAVILNFGGLCVLLQTASVAEGLNLRYYLLGKLLQTGFCILFALVFLGHYGAMVPIILFFLPFLRRNPAKKGSIPARIGV